MNDSLTKKPEQQGGELNKAKKFGLGSLHARIDKANVEAKERESQALTMPNRLVLMLDVSGSMGCMDGNARRIDNLKNAIVGFLQSCTWDNTSVGIETFGAEGRRETQIALSCDQNMLTLTAHGLEAMGGTPMHRAMKAALENHPLTRGVLVSDGQADSPAAALGFTSDYAAAGVPIDTVHIGSAPDGEQTLKEIAEKTGGLFIKFTDVSQFAKNFKYLTPAFRAMLTSGAVDAKALGAREVE